MRVSQLKFNNKVSKLKQEGWETLNFVFDLEYLNKLGLDTLLEKTGDFIYQNIYTANDPETSLASKLSHYLSSNNRDRLITFINNFSFNPIIKYHLDSFNKIKITNEDIDNELFKIIINYLGKPNEIYQELVDEDNGVWESDVSNNIYKLPVSKFKSIDNLISFDSLYLFYSNDITIKIKSKHNKVNGYVLSFPNIEARNNTINKALGRIAIFKTKYNTIIGAANSKYLLNSFNTNVLALTRQCKEKVEEINNNFSSDKLVILISGKPGVGKTSWVNAFIKEIVSPLDYLTIHLDLDSLNEYTPIPYVNNVCLIINDGDNLALARENRSDGFTERVMSLLDGNYFNAIKSDKHDNQKLIVFITANTTERWDEAALRKGRIDININFDKPLYE